MRKVRERESESESESERESERLGGTKTYLGSWGPCAAPEP